VTEQTLPPPSPRSQRTTGPAQQPRGTRNSTIVIGSVLGIIAVAAVVAILVSRGGDDTVSTDATTTTAAAAGATSVASAGPVASEVQPVTVDGTAMSPMPDSPADDTDIGQPVPALSGAGFDGKPVAITPGADGKMMVVFLAHWCPHCQREVPRLVQWIADGKSPSDVRIVAIATQTSKDSPNYPPSKWLAKEQWPADVMADSTTFDAAAAYGAPGWPYIVLINADGTLAARTSGEISMDDLSKLIANNLK
jgi:cytochrome c biogenesis protein CcmG, thiol:disulfide interchange protein DsbE